MHRFGDSPLGAVLGLASRALFAGYAKQGQCQEAWIFWTCMPSVVHFGLRDAMSWNALIVGYVWDGHAFRRPLAHSRQRCQTGAAEGTCCHLVEFWLDLYALCASLSRAETIFGAFSFWVAISWNVLIALYAAQLG